MLRVIREFEPTWVIAENVRGLLTLQQGVVFEQVCVDLEASGYEVQPLIIPAVAVNAPHRRDRVWFIGFKKDVANGEVKRGQCRESRESRESAQLQEKLSGRIYSGEQNTSNAKCSRFTHRVSGQKQEERSGKCGNETKECYGWDANWIEVASELCRVDDGIPVELGGLKLSKAGHRNAQLKAYGNAIVPAVAIEIMQAIKLSTEKAWTAL